MGLEQVPWEQNERSLQNIRDAKDASDIKDQTQTDLNIKKSTKMRTFVENSTHENSVNNEIKKNDNPKPDARKEINGTDMLDKKEVIELNNRHLNEANSSPKVSEDNKESSNFLDISFPDIIANDESLDTRKEKKNSANDSNILKRSSIVLEKSNLIAKDISKKFKISTINEIKKNDKNLIDKNGSLSIMNEDVKSSCSRSPSLFDDSLNLDTQMYDILEQNMDIAHLTGFDSKVLVNKLDVANTLQKESTNSNIGNVQLCGENNAKNIDATNVQSKNSILSWGDDSWNNSEGLLKRIAQDQNVIQSKKEICKIKNVINTNVSITLKDTKICTQNSKDSMHKADIKKHTAAIKRKVPRKPKLPKVTEVGSPMVDIIVFRKERKMSADSNKSDSDDFIVGSQHFESPFSNSKSRTRTTLEKMRKLRSQKLAEDTIAEINNCLNSPIKEIPNDITKDKIKEKERRVKPKLKEILTQNVLFSANSSIDSIIYNSEEETMNNSTRTTQRSTLKTRQYEMQSNKLNKDLKSKTESVLSDKKKDLLDQTIDWNTLNIVKVANSRATFNLFKREVLKKRNISLALHCDTYVDNTNNIGSKICVANTEGKRKSRRSGNYAYDNKEIRGVAISWESNIAYYISFSNSQGKKNVFQSMLFNCKLLF